MIAPTTETVSLVSRRGRERAAAVELYGRIAATPERKALLRRSWEAGEICLDLDEIKSWIPGWDDATVLGAVRLLAALKGWRKSAEEQELRFLWPP